MPLFAEFALVLAVATGMAVVMRLLQQPLIIGHILTGLVVGPFILNIATSNETLTLMSELGIAVLLFTVGLHLSPDVIKQFGRVSLVTGLGQVLFTSIVGYFVCTALGFPPLSAFYISVALSFSSTIIVLKLISDKGDLEALYAKLAIGFLIVQDLVAVLLLLAIPMFSGADTTPLTALRFLVTGGLLIAFVIFASRFFVSKAVQFISESNEFLLLFAVTWGISIAALFSWFGFSPESGALIAGVVLASFPAKQQISARLMPLRDFFIVMFFILLGAHMNLHQLPTIFVPALLLSLFVLVSNPLILMVLTGWLGYLKKTSLKTGLVIAQISEFSLILIALGVQVGHLDQSVLSLVTLIGLITIFASTYMVRYSDQVYRTMEPFLHYFEREGAHEQDIQQKAHQVILFGCDRAGYDFVRVLHKLGKSILIVDHDPRVVERLKKLELDVVYGDADTYDFLDSIDFSGTELVISTLSDANTNAMVQRMTREKNHEAIVVVVASKIKEALAHYQDGVEYVILPHLLGAKHAAELIAEFQSNKAKYHDLRREHIDYLQLRLNGGPDQLYAHPSDPAL
jgi:Kef-type K+ transport system membrane component KefB